MNGQNISQMSGVMRLTQRGADSMSQKSISKFSDNASDGNYNQQQDNKKKMDKYNTAKHGGQGVPHGNGGLADLKIENSKNQTFNSDIEDSHSV